MFLFKDMGLEGRCKIMKAPQGIIDDNDLEKEYDLVDVTVKRIDLVDEPCVPKAIIRIIKNKEDMKVADEKQETEDLELTEEEVEELEKSLSEAVELIQEEMDKIKDEKKKKRLNMILANLKGLTKKDEDDKEKDEEKEKAEKALKDELVKELKDELAEEYKKELKEELLEEVKEEVEKAGKSISLKTASELEKIVAAMKSALNALEAISKPGKHDDYKKPDEYPKPKTTKKSFDLTELEKHAKKTYELYKNEQMDEAERDLFVGGLFDIMKSLMEDTDEEEGGEE